jgi:DNA invertase Pin-like site-specific DNA recombinase
MKTSTNCLTPNLVRRIRKLAKQRHSDTWIAKRFGVSNGLIGRIRMRQIWAHVPDRLPTHGIPTHKRKAKVRRKRANPIEPPCQPQVINGDLEQWAVLKRWPEYAVSSHGRLWSLRKGRLRKPEWQRTGYIRATLTNRNGKHVGIQMHQLVASAFCKKTKALENNQLVRRMTVNHIDATTSNNCWWNLEWATPKEQMKHAASFGLLDRGKMHHNAKLKEKDAVKARIWRQRGMTIPKICRRLKSHRQAVERALQNDYHREPLGYCTPHAIKKHLTLATVGRWHLENPDKPWPGIRGYLKRQKAAFRRARAKVDTSRLTAQVVYDIRETYAAGSTVESLAVRFLVDHSAVSRIVSGKTYRWVTAPDSVDPALVRARRARRAKTRASTPKKPNGHVMHGLANPRTKVTPRIARRIRRLAKLGISQRAIAAKIGLASHANVNKVLNGQHWTSKQRQAA